MFCATVLYPNKQSSTFDFEHYAGILAPMYAKSLGPKPVEPSFEDGYMRLTHQ